MGLTLEAINVSDEWFEHHGVKGQKWGVRRTPEQLGHILQKKNARHYGKYNKAVRKIAQVQGSKTVDQLTPKERAKIEKAINAAEKQLHKIDSSEKKYNTKIEKATARQKKIEAKEGEKEEKKKADIEKKKEKLAKSSKWDEVYKNKELFTTDELNSIATRINSEKKLKDALDNNNMDKVAKKIKSAANLVGSGVELYNKVKDVQNIFEAGNREKAYKEIRQLMAEGNNADVIKKSVKISDKDVELFSKRAAFLKSMNQNISNIGEDKYTKPDWIETHAQKKVFDDFMKKMSEDAEKEPLHGTVEGVGRSKNKGSIFDGPIIDVDYEDVVMNDIGGMKLLDFKV